MTDTNQLPERLRKAITEIRRKPYPISDLIPLLSAAADALQARAQVQGEVCPTCGETEPYTGSCGTSNNDTKALCKQQAQATQAEVTDAALIRELVDHIERNTCTHEETHRGGVIWEVCDSCGAKWADDEGGKPEFKWPAVVEKARAILSLHPQAVPMTVGIRPEDFTVDVVVKPMGGFAPVNTQGVRVTHKPTGISVTCDTARSQHMNRHQAFEKLSAILSQRPERVPMTDEQIRSMCRQGWVFETARQWVNVIEAHHGIKPKEQA